ncbi:hypothetical protein ATO8_14412 [Roseivivax marinus]|jgi:hypothetical protein|uniref:Uncharacterized protein n=1 Tax=Roseivivax marinus TaxID=1379903 RepID=W4HGK6_9RHOB|nr:hypothetical protein [Roseivivax marinus]ETW11867.1 hypothetical protein ATO8_14412 [Roseivivax marinus]
MILKVVLLFLVFMGVMGMFGKWRRPRLPRFGAGKCPDCGRHRIGKGPCPCKQNRNG